MITGYRGFNRMFVKSFPVMSSGFQSETEFTIHALGKPLLFFFSILSFIFFVFGLIFGIPVINEFIHTDFITKIPSSILASGLMIFSLLLLVTGLILDTVVTNAKKEYELNLYRLYEKYNQIRNL